MNIAILLGSARIGRQSHKVARLLNDTFQKYEGVESRVLDLAHYQLPMMEERYGLHPDPPEAVKRMARDLEGVEALILLTPEYNGSYSGILKNAVEYFARHWAGKPIGTVTTSAGKFGGLTASHQVQHLILSIGAYPMPLKLIVPFVQDSLDASLREVAPELQQQTEQFAERFLSFARAIVQISQQPLQKRLSERISLS